MSTPDSIKTQIQNLISTANTTTGKSDTDLTTAITSLISGYGGGGDVTYNGLRYSEGTFYKDTDAMPFTIQHNCGFIPEIFILYPKFEVTFGSANEEVGFVGYYGDLFGELPNQRCGFLLENRTTYTETCTWQLASTWKTISNVLINEEVIVVPYRSASYPFKTGVEYGWIAIANKTKKYIDIERIVSSITFTDMDLFDTENLVLNLDKVTNLYQLFNNASNTKVKMLTLNCPNQVTGSHYVFSISSTTVETALEKIVFNVDISKATRVDYMFSRRKNIKVIDGYPLDFSGVTYNSYGGAFLSCSSLEEVRFVEGCLKLSLNIAQSSNLSDTSIQSIIDGLATVETAQTLTLHADVKAKLTEEQISTITSKNWTLA